MLKIVILSDTHMPKMAKKLPGRLLAELPGAEAILHAGDWTDISVYESLRAYAPVYGVAGNNDGGAIVRKFGWKRMVDFGGCRIGIIHGHGLGGRSDTESRAEKAFGSDEIDVLVYGHSHIPVVKRKENRLIVNPGSPTDKRRAPRYSFAIMHIDKGRAEVRLIEYGDKS
jgi:putative phosphoesterase